MSPSTSAPKTDVCTDPGKAGGAADQKQIDEVIAQLEREYLHRIAERESYYKEQILEARSRYDFVRVDELHARWVRERQALVQELERRKEELAKEMGLNNPKEDPN